MDLGQDGWRDTKRDTKRRERVRHGKQASETPQSISLDILFSERFLMTHTHAKQAIKAVQPNFSQSLLNVFLYIHRP